MDECVEFFGRLFTRAPVCFVAWPAVAMIAGAIIGTSSSRFAARFAIVPRTGKGLVGLVTAPFIHANLAHLAANLPAFVILGVLVLRHGESRFAVVSGVVMLGQGLLVWLLGRKAAHVGMSGVIFGYFGWLVALAWFTRTTPDLLAAGGVLVFYGGMLAGIAPARDGTSWEGHLFGLLSGVGAAWFQFWL